MKTDDSPGLRQLLERLRDISAQLPAAEEYVMVHHPAFRVGKKPFAIAGMEAETKGATLSINLGPDAQMQLLDDGRFSKTPYIGQHGWVTITHKQIEDSELEALVVESWRRVANGKQRAQLAGAPAKPAPRTAAKKKKAATRKR